MKRTKNLTFQQVITLIEQCKFYADSDHICNECPLFGECLYYYTGDDSELWENEENEERGNKE